MATLEVATRLYADAVKEKAARIGTKRRVNRRKYKTEIENVLSLVEQAARGGESEATWYGLNIIVCDDVAEILKCDGFNAESHYYRAEFGNEQSYYVTISGWSPA